ncbi:MAG: hypothetical protein IH994_12230 [Proteobacteria bacterium]|nr:hypothetical protein [Pseudomonadota bacterium]
METVVRMPAPDSPEWVHSLDPGGVFDQWHDACREWCSDMGIAADDSDFARRGFEKMTFMDPAAADDLRRRVDAGAETPDNVTDIGDYQDTVKEGNPDFLFGLLETLLTLDLERRVMGYFQSHFFVHWYQFTRAYPHPKADSSFLWHRDGGPGAFVNIMVYLNPAGEHGGGTQLLDRETTAKLAQAGYDYPDVVDRVGDLSEYAEAAGVSCEPWESAMNLGEGLIFQPDRVLHRGLLPTRGTRYVLFLNLLPSCRPWREGFRRWPLNFMEIVAGNWTVDYIPLLAADDGPRIVQS